MHVALLLSANRNYKPSTFNFFVATKTIHANYNGQGKQKSGAQPRMTTIDKINETQFFNV